MGSGFTHLFQRVDIRFGELKSLSNSAFKNALIGRGSEKSGVHSFFFLDYGTQWVIHNILIEGSLWTDNAPHTEEVKPFVRHWRIGWATSSRNTTFKMIYNGLGPEVTGNEVHGFVTLELALRLTPRNLYRSG